METWLDHLAKYLRIPFHPCSLIMHALPKILRETPLSFFDDYRLKLATASHYVFDGLSKIRDLTPIKATASKYLMVCLHFDQFRSDSGIIDDKNFVLKLWEEESVLTLPSRCFYETGFIRFFTCISIDTADEFLARTLSFYGEMLY